MLILTCVILGLVIFAQAISYLHLDTKYQTLVEQSDVKFQGLKQEILLNRDLVVTSKDSISRLSSDLLARVEDVLKEKTTSSERAVEILGAVSEERQLFETKKHKELLYLELLASDRIDEETFEREVGIPVYKRVSAARESHASEVDIPKELEEILILISERLESNENMLKKVSSQVEFLYSEMNE